MREQIYNLFDEEVGEKLFIRKWLINYASELCFAECFIWWQHGGEGKYERDSNIDQASSFVQQVDKTVAPRRCN